MGRSDGSVRVARAQYKAAFCWSGPRRCQARSSFPGSHTSSWSDRRYKSPSSGAMRSSWRKLSAKPTFMPQKVFTRRSLAARAISTVPSDEPSSRMSSRPHSGNCVKIDSICCATWRSPLNVDIKTMGRMSMTQDCGGRLWGRLIGNERPQARVGWSAMPRGRLAVRAQPGALVRGGRTRSKRIAGPCLGLQSRAHGGW